MKTYAYSFFMLLCVLLRVQAYAEPLWWKDRGVIPIDSNQRSPETIINNYSPANLGQLKFFAKKAKEEMDSKLADGAGSEINALVAGFAAYSEQDPDANYAPLNIGQLKAVSKAFYNRLAEVSSQVVYPNGMVLISDGKYPWPPMPPNPTEEDYRINYAPANIGQLKFLFAWSFIPMPVIDTDNDGIDDRWEYYYFGNLTTANETSNYTGENGSDKQKYLTCQDPSIGEETCFEVYTPLER